MNLTQSSESSAVRRRVGHAVHASRGLIGSGVLLVVFAATAGSLAAWKYASLQAAAASIDQPEPVELISVAVATEYVHHPMTTSIGTVRALRSITLRNEVPGTVARVGLTPGQVVDAGTLLVAMDVSVEQAELRARQAQANLAQTQLDRVQRALKSQAVSETELDRARAERDVALAEVARLEAIINRKTIRAPFRARVGMVDLHPGQYLEAGSRLTTLQGVDEALHIDFSVAQRVAAKLSEGDRIPVDIGGGEAIDATVIAIDARVDPATRNAMVRARIDATGKAIRPGASVRVHVPAGVARQGVNVPISALRRGPEGDHVYVVPDVGDVAEMRAERRMVQAGAMVGDAVVVSAGLAAGERVAASGSFKLYDGVRVDIADDQEPLANLAR
ncbi:efflux RND transporter periplasmic adaptor subunit [Phycisphaerales bacterium AB-hyl4]|uniref:Efflux RND transporter periplasmic adaptor subunit n=1 Tax=Natronomicrosphaera hydrolytica TaxID=3242702 RepID=A0ABV4UB86_9BACT